MCNDCAQRVCEEQLWMIEKLERKFEIQESGSEGTMCGSRLFDEVMRCTVTESVPRSNKSSR